MSIRDELLKQIRVMGKGTRGAPPAILDLPDSTLYEVFQQMQRGLSNRSIARHLRQCGMTGSENSLQQSVSLFRKRIAPLLGSESATLSLPLPPMKLPENFSSLPPDETLSTLTEIIRFYGQAIRQATKAAAENGTPLSEDLAKHIKAYDTLVARKARMEQNVIKDWPVEHSEDREDLCRFELLADIVHEYLTENGDGDKMVRASKIFLARIAQKCILMDLDHKTGEYYRVTGRPGRSRTG